MPEVIGIGAAPHRKEDLRFLTGRGNYVADQFCCHAKPQLACNNVVGRSCRPTLGYSRQSNRKANEGSKHPDRNAQFEHINAKAIAAQAAGLPVISRHQEERADR